jgi:hypothetical protein
MDWQGHVRCLDERGREQWSREVKHVTRLAAGPEAKCAAAYWPGNPLHSGVQFLGEDGEEQGTVLGNGPVECVALSRDGSRGAIGCRGGALYLVRLGTIPPKVQVVRAEGAVKQLFFAHSNAVYYVTEEPTGLGRVAADGTREWYRRGPSDVEYLVSSAPEGSWIAVVERSHGRQTHGLLQLWNGRGTVAWTRPLDGWPTAVRVAQGAVRIVVGVERRSTVGQAARLDRAMLCFGPDGTRLWRKGGTFLENPLFVGMDEGGEWVVSLGGHFRFWLFGDQGEYRWRRSTRSPVQIAVASADGSSIGVAFAGGRLAWLHIPRPPDN